MVIWRYWRTAFVLVATVLALGTPAMAQSAWTVDAVQGTLVRLEADRWIEVAVSEVVPIGVPLRTLAGSTAHVQGSAGSLTLGSATLVRLLRSRTTSVLIEQYSGSIDIDAIGARGGLTLRTPTVEITTDGGALAVEIAGGMTSYTVETGTARVIDVATGDATVLVAGTPAASSSVDRAAPAEASAASNPGPGAGNGNGGAQGNSGSGQGNANGNGNGNGAGQGNSGNGQGNSGNGQGNSGNGQGNSGDGNGNNGNGNGNGNNGNK